MEGMKPEVKVGDKLWHVNSYSSFPNEYLTVNKVGRKWFYLSNGTKWGVDDWKQQTEYTSGRLYISEEAWREETALRDAWDDLKREVGKRYKPLTIEQIEIIRSWLSQ